VSSVSEREVEKPVTLREEEVEVERRGEDRRLSPGEADRAFQEETVEVTATSERPVVSKEARVTGEVALRKQTGEREEVVRDTLRARTWRSRPSRSSRRSAEGQARPAPGAPGGERAIALKPRGMSELPQGS
jgi:hypothetical protein